MYIINITSLLAGLIITGRRGRGGKEREGRKEGRKEVVGGTHYRYKQRRGACACARARARARARVPIHW